MKKFTLTLLILLGTIYTLAAQQNVKEDIFAYLRSEGYVPSYDDDGDIQFKMEGIGYYAIVKELADEGYAYVEVMANFSTDTPYETLLTLCNELNRTKYVCKCLAYENEDDNVFAAAMEFITGSSADTRFQMKHALRLLPVWLSALEEQLE